MLPSRSCNPAGAFPFLKKIFADSADQGPVFHEALGKVLPHLETHIVKNVDTFKGHPK